MTDLVVDFLHLPVLVVSLGGPWVVPPKYLPVLLIFYIHILIDWADFDKKCSLTVIANELSEEETEGRKNFTHRLVNAFGVEVSGEVLMEILWFIVSVNAIATFMKLHPDWHMGKKWPWALVLFLWTAWATTRYWHFHATRTNANAN